jgi:cytochrome P450
MTSTLIHQDESVSPDAHTFKPERWVNDPTGQLDRYMVAFSKSSRNCLGMPLAWAEPYLCLGGIFRRFGSPDVRGKDDKGVLELFETDITDVEIVGDLFFPSVKEDSKGIRVKVLN